YLDGKTAGTATLAKSATATTTNVVIGRLSNGAGCFNGFIRDACVWSVARTPVQLGGDLQRAPAVDNPQSAVKPIACWRLDEATAPKVPNGPVVTLDAVPPTDPANRLR